MPGEEKKEEQKGTPPVIELELEDGTKKAYTPEDVKSLIGKVQQAEKTSSVAAKAIQAAEKYGLDPDGYIGNAEGAFALLTKLQEEGFLNENWEPVKKEVKDEKKTVQNFQTPDPKSVIGEEKIAAIVAKAITPFQERISELEGDLSGMLRLDIERQMKAKHENLDDLDVSQVLALAMKDRSKTVWQHAEVKAKAKEMSLGDLRRRHAEEFGINLEEFDRNKLNQQDGKGTSGFLKGKKLTFNKGKDPKAVTPREATKAYFENLERQ